MSNTLQPMTAKDFFSRDIVKTKFAEILGARSTQFITSVLQIVASNNLLAKADVQSIYQSAMVAATLDLPLNNNLGFAYIVPYNTKQPDGTSVIVAQFQMGYKGFKQLALRTGQFKLMNATDVREGEISIFDRMTGEIQFNWIEDIKQRMATKVIGYVSYFELNNGYRSTFFMPIEHMEAHGKRYSQTYKKGYGLWRDDFDAMALKTVTKLNLSKNAPLSVEMQKATISDQAVVLDADKNEVKYLDNVPEYEDVEVISQEKEDKRIEDYINQSTTQEQLDQLKESGVELSEYLTKLLKDKEKEVNGAKK